MLDRLLFVRGWTNLERLTVQDELYLSTLGGNRTPTPEGTPLIAGRVYLDSWHKKKPDHTDRALS